MGVIKMDYGKLTFALIVNREAAGILRREASSLPDNEQAEYILNNLNDKMIAIAKSAQSDAALLDYALSPPQKS